jgi:chemotaxis protein histidine kinase CheA
MGERERDRAEADRAEAEQAEANRAEAEQAETERAEADRAEQAEAEQTEANRAEAEQAEAERAEAERAEADRAEPEPQQAPPVAPAPVQQTQGWGAGRIALVVIGSLLALAALAAVIGGATGLVFDQTQRDAAGYLMTDSKRFATPSYALVSDSYKAGTASDWVVVGDLLGTVRIRSTSARPVFVGLARASDVEGYLGGVEREVATEFDADPSDFQSFPGQTPATPPAEQDFWAASASGSGAQTVTWKPQDGSWRIVVMDPQAGAGVSTQLAVGAKFPDLIWISLGLLLGGLVVLGLAVWMIYAGAREPAR